MLAAELLKIRRLPTPRLTLAVVLGLITVACVAVLIAQPSPEDAEWYFRAPQLAANIGGTIGAMVLGAWMIGVEFASRTVRLAATVQPDRTRLVTIKLAVTILLLATYSGLILAVTFGAQHLMCQIGDVALPSSVEFNKALGSATTSILWGLFSFALVLLLRSYTAGLIAGIVLALGVDDLVQLIPKVGNYTFGAATNSIFNSFTGDPMDLALSTAIAATAAWIVGVALLGAMRFGLRDLK